MTEKESFLGVILKIHSNESATRGEEDCVVVIGEARPLKVEASIWRVPNDMSKLNNGVLC